MPLSHSILSKLLFAFLAYLFSVSTYPQTTPITLVFKQEMDWGVLSNENGTCTMDKQGNLSATGGQSCFGVGNRAKYQAFGDAGFAIIITTAGSSSNGMTLVTDIKGSNSKTLNSTGKKNIWVHGDLILNNVTPGNFSLSYILSVNYE